MPANHRLSLRALTDLRQILEQSTQKWGEDRAERYVSDIYKVFAKIADKPELGTRRKPRAYPFLMVPAGKHFVIYQAFPDVVLILTVQHQCRDIEGLVRAMRKSLLSDINAFQKRLN